MNYNEPKRSTLGSVMDGSHSPREGIEDLRFGPYDLNPSNHQHGHIHEMLEKLDFLMAREEKIKQHLLNKTNGLLDSCKPCPESEISPGHDYPEAIHMINVGFEKLCSVQDDILNILSRLNVV